MGNEGLVASSARPLMPAAKAAAALRRWRFTRAAAVVALCLLGLLAAGTLGHRWLHGVRKVPGSSRPAVNSEKDEMPSSGIQEGVEAAHIHPVRSDKSAPSALAWFHYIKDSDGTLTLHHKIGEYITVLENKKMVARTATRGGSQSFVRIDNHDGTISLMARGGTYVTSLKSGTMVADGPFVQSWQKFTEINGPDGIAFKSSQGNFVEIQLDSSELEYGLPGTGQPEDAAQFEASSNDVDYIVAINATGENITDAEKFTLLKDNLDRTVSLKTTYGTYLTAPELLDGFVTAANDHIAGREAFEMAYTPAGLVSFRTFDGRWCSCLAHGSITASAEKVGEWESFERIDNSDGTISLKSWHGKYVSAIKKAKQAEAKPG